MNPNKLGSVAPGGGAEKTSNFTAEQNPVKNFEAEKNSEKPKTGAEIFEMKMHQIADRRDMIERMKMEGKLGSDDYKTKKQALDLVETKLTKLYNIYENREVNEAEREKEFEIQNRYLEESKDSLRKSAKNKESKMTTRSSIASEEELLDFYKSAISCEKSTDYLPLSTTAWGQGSPYNCKLAQDCPTKSDGRYDAGCGVVAIAQAMAYYEPSLIINGTPINWKELKRTNKINSSSPKTVKNQVGYLMKWIGEKVGATYTCSGTTTKRNSIVTALNLVGMKCDNRIDWNWNTIYQSLKQGKLVHADAITEKNKGHAWIIDGFLIGNMPDSTDLVSVHINMGWGGSDNGYYEIEPEMSFEGGGHTLKYKFGINPHIAKK